MLIEDILLLVLLLAAVFLIGIPFLKLMRVIVASLWQLFPKTNDPVLEAKKRLEIAEKEAEAAKLNKRVEDIYSHLYEDTLQEDENEQLNEGKRHK